jgi:hypothetical protein
LKFVILFVVAYKTVELGSEELGVFLKQVEVLKQHSVLSAERGSNFKRIPSFFLRPLPQCFFNPSWRPSQHPSRLPLLITLEESWL